MLLSSELVRSKHRPSISLISRAHNHTLEIPSFSWFHMVGPHSSGQHSPLSCCLSSLFRSSPINWPRESATSGSTLRRKTGTGDKWRHRACSILTSTQILGPWLLVFPFPPPLPTPPLLFAKIKYFGSGFSRYKWEMQNPSTLEQLFFAGMLFN